MTDELRILGFGAAASLCEAISETIKRVERGIETSSLLVKGGKLEDKASEYFNGEIDNQKISLSELRSFKAHVHARVFEANKEGRK